MSSLAAKRGRVLLYELTLRTPVSYAGNSQAEQRSLTFLRKVRRLLLILFTCQGLAVCQSNGRYVDWPKVAPEILEHFSALLRIDTSNPPGNETAAAKYIQGVLERNGIPSKLMALEPSRANLVARINGNGRKRPILVMGHTDVVGVQREKWTVDPFAAIRKDGYMFPEAITLPTMLAGATDMAQLRAKGIQAYGFGPIIEEKDRDRGRAHGDDERLMQNSLEKLVEFLWQAVLEVAAAR